MNGTVVTRRGHIYTFKDAEWLDRFMLPITTSSPEGEPYALTWEQKDSGPGAHAWRNIVFVREIERVAIDQGRVGD